MSQGLPSPYKESHWPPPREQPYSNTYSGPPAYPSPSTPSLPPKSEMLTLPPPPSTSHMAQDPYRPPPAHYDPYGGGPPGQMPYPPGGHHGMPPQHQQQSPVNFAQPAPRQRTAIACRYCRRRKIRCHGFDQSPDGRCTNCARFHQECIFTPVSSQAHAFVPAHTAYPHLRTAGRGGPPDGRSMYAQGPPVYSAHGQPLGPVGGHQHEGYHPPPPPPPQQYGQSQYPHYDDRASAHGPDRGPPPARRSSGAGYEYPDPSQMAPVSPATAGSGYAAPGPYPPAGQSQPYYQPQPPRRPSPPSSSYGYDGRSSTSPHGSTPSTSYSNYGGLHPPQALPAYDPTRTPPPGPGRETNGTTNGSRPGMSVRDMLGPEPPGGGRSSADSDMLKALNRRGM